MITEVFYYELPIKLKKKIDDLLQRLDKECKEFNEREAKKIASNYALANLPRNSDQSLEPFIEQIRAFFMRQNTNIAIDLEGQVRQELATMNVANAKGESVATERELRKLNDENKRDSIDLQNMELEIDKRSAKKFNKLLTLLGIVEGVGYTLSYLKLGDSILLAAVWGFLLGFAQSYAIKLLVLWLRDRATALTMIHRFAIIGVYALIVMALGGLRFLSVQGSANAFAHSPLMIFIFIVVTLLLTAFVAGFTYLYYPNREQERIMQEHDTLEEKIQARKKQIAVLEAKLAKIRNDLHVISQLHRRMQMITLEMHKRMQAFFKEGVAGFRLENLIKRTDGLNPPCLSQEVAPLQFKDEVYETQIPEIETV